MADIQISATGGDVTEQTSIQIRRGSTVTDSPSVEDDVEQFSAHEREELTETGVSQEGRPIVPSSGYEDPLHYEDPVMHISGAGHWFLEGWIGDHSVEFLVDSGSSVTAMSDIFHRGLVQAGAPVGALQITARTLRSANGTGIEVLGCSRCSVSFLGLQTEFPIIVCSLAAGTDAIIGTDVLGSVLPHTLDIKNGLLFARGGASLQLHRRDSALSGRVFTVGHSSIPPYSEAVLHCSVRMAMSQQFLPPGNKYTGSFTEDTEGDGVRLNAFNHEDADVAFDPLSANRRFSGTADLAVLGTLVFAGPTRETISVMVPDCLMPPENDTVRVDLRHHVGLSLGPAVDMTNWSPEDHLERALCPASLADTLGLQRREYWEELNPILKRWKSVNKSSCPDCQKFIQINMGRHIRLKHTTYMCFWRCPVMSCSLWFTAELNAKDHIEGIHKFKEGEGTSFYECLRRHGIEWFGSPLQHLEAGRLGASTPQHVTSRPAVPDLCIASSSLLSVLDPLPMDRLSRHTVAEICSWPATDRHAILAVANRDVRVARQNIAELLLYVDDHAAHLANCASADDDSLTLMSAELLPRLEGGIRAALEEVDNI